MSDFASNFKMNKGTSTFRSDLREHVGKRVYKYKNPTKTTPMALAVLL